MKVLLFGSKGQLGGELARGLSQSSVELATVDRSTVDLSNTAQIRRVIRSSSAEVIINAAAYTAVDRAESESELARAVNAVAPAVMSEECKRAGALLVHYSTDYVFDGNKRSPYMETDTPAPLNVYGRTKWEGDQAIMFSGARYLIFRVGWVYSARGKNFLLTVLRLVREGKPLRIVDDQIGVPTSANAVADLTVRAISRELSLEGLFHYAPSGSASWFAFASEIIRNTRPTGISIEAISSRDYPAAAVRPSFSVLSSLNLQGRFPLTICSWQAQLAGLMAYLAVDQR